MIKNGHNSAARYSQTLSFAGHACLLHTNSERLVELASAFFPSTMDRKEEPSQATITLLAQCRRGASSNDGNFPIFRGRNEFVHADYGRDGSVWFDLRTREVAGVVSNEIIADEGFCRRSVLSVIAGILAPALGIVGLHAGCVVRNGKAVLLAAPSGMGKSTLSLALALRGWNLLSDDWTFLSAARSELKVWGMQTSIKLLPDASFYFPGLSALSPAISLNGELAFEIDPWTFFRVVRAIDATPVAIVFLERISAYSTTHICDVKEHGADQTLKSLLNEIEEHPDLLAEQNSLRNSLLKQICRLPCLEIRFSGEPVVVAADLDEIFTERLYA